LEALFCPGALHDLLPLAEPNAGANRAVLVPERVELIIERLDLLHQLRVTAVGKPMPEFCAALADLVDLFVNARDDVHALSNARRNGDIPVSRGHATETQLLRRRPPRMRSRGRCRGCLSFVAELGEAVFVEAEVVTQLVQDGDPDLALE